MNEYLREHYQRLLITHGDSYASAQYSSRESQEARYAVLTQIADLRNCSVLDWGCGTGHLATWLDAQDVHCRYTGVDIVPEFLKIGQSKHPGHRFGEMKDFEGEVFDWCIVSGAFNNLIDDNYGALQHHVKELWQRCERGLAFNLMCSWVDYEDPNLWYARPEEIFSFMKTLTPYVTVRNDYVVKNTPVPFEFAVYAYRLPVWCPK